MSLSRNEIKMLRSLSRKKVRDAEGLFLAEGPKVVGDLLGHFPCTLLAAVPAFLQAHRDVARQVAEVREVSEKELSQVSLLQAPQDVIAVFRKVSQDVPSWAEGENGLVLALDGVQDPGNVGTILRTADWFGIRRILCSTDTADAFGPKVVQATMGALAHVSVETADLAAKLQGLGEDVPIYGTFLDGDNIYEAPLTSHGVIVMGNEGKGISAAVAATVNRRLFIPPFPGDVLTGESLNVGVATGIVCAAFRFQCATH